MTDRAGNTSKITDDLIEKLGRATASWIAYHSLLGLHGLLAESTLSVPVSTFLRANTGLWIETEKNHPIFAESELEQKAKGRPLQLDLGVLNRSRKLVAAFEFKKADCSGERLVRDLIRLVCLSGNIGGAQIQRFLLLTGSKEEINKQLTRGMNHDGARILIVDSLLTTEKTRSKTISVKNLPGPMQSLFHRSERSLFGEKFEGTSCHGLSSKLIADSQTEGYRVLIWRVTAKKGPKGFQ